MPDPAPGFILYHEPGGPKLSVRLEGKTAWLTQAQMAELFQTTPQNITQHIASIYADAELAEGATCKEFLQVRNEGSRQVQRALAHYSLDMILAVGYRVRSPRGTAFRQWATTILAEYLVKGFALDDQRLKDNRAQGQDYFDELLARIRDIRASERRFYQKIADIYATSIDYDPKAALTQDFFATVQNKLHWAIHAHTAAEVIRERADASKPNMGLTTWNNARAGPIRKSDVSVAKNYLSQDEITELNRVVTMYLDYAEDQARRRVPMHMSDWITRLDAFLKFNDRDVLANAGKISADLARDHAEREFAKFDESRRLSESTKPTDFDEFLSRTRRLDEGDPTQGASPR